MAPILRFMVLFFLIGAGYAHKTTHAQERPRTDRAIALPPATRPAIPDGLYMSNVNNSAPVLLVKNGQWIDPYEWVKGNGLDALNAQFIQGKDLEVFNANTWLRSIAGTTLHSLSPEQLLAHGTLKSGSKAALRALAPRISDYECGSGGVDVWHCRSAGVLTKSRPLKACSTDGCGNGLVASTVAYRQLTQRKMDSGVPQLNLGAIAKQVEVEFKARASPDMTRNRVRASAFPIEVFYGPAKQRLTSGFMRLAFKTNTKWKARFDGEISPEKEVNLGFIWDVGRARFAYLQAAPNVFDKTAQSVCDAGRKPYYCAHASPVGGWEAGGRFYAVWAYSQPFANYLPTAHAKSPDGQKILIHMQYQIHEVDLEKALHSTIFQTQAFLSVN